MLHHPAFLRRSLPLHDALGDITGDGIGNGFHILPFVQQRPAEPGILDEAVGALVTRHNHVRGRVDPVARWIGGQNRQRQIPVAFRNVAEDAFKGFLQHRKAHPLLFLQFRDSIVALRLFKPRRLDRRLQIMNGSLLVTHGLRPDTLPKLPGSCQFPPPQA